MVGSAIWDIDAKDCYLPQSRPRVYTVGIKTNILQCDKAGFPDKPQAAGQVTFADFLEEGPAEDPAPKTTKLSQSLSFYTERFLSLYAPGFP